MATVMEDGRTELFWKKLKRQVVESICHSEKKPWHRTAFQWLLLLTIISLTLCYALTSNYRLWSKSIDVKNHQPNQTYPSQGFNNSNETTEIQYHLAYPRNYQFIMDHTDVCKAKAPFLVLMVEVATYDMAARDAIRRTWGKETLVQGERVKTLFLLGLPGGDDAEQKQQRIRAENLLYNDLIQSNFMDTYLNLTIKTMVIMDWLATRCPEAAYAMKIDADMFLNVDNLVIMLKKPGIPKQNYLTGLLKENMEVLRNKDSKWYVSEELFPDPVYPTYALGMGYVFSNDLTEKFVQASKAIKPFNIEDAYIGMCMKNLGLKLTAPPDMSQFKAYFQHYDRCEFSKVITYILVSPEDLLKFWADVKRPGSPCQNKS